MLSETTEMIRMSSKLKQVAVRFEPELLEKLEERASKDRRPLASLIRKICHEAIAPPGEPRHAA